MLQRGIAPAAAETTDIYMNANLKPEALELEAYMDGIGRAARAAAAVLARADTGAKDAALRAIAARARARGFQTTEDLTRGHFGVRLDLVSGTITWIPEPARAALYL